MVISPREIAAPTKEELIKNSPPDWIMCWNFREEGWFMAMMNSGEEATGEAISSSEIATVQLAVPPRTSAP